MISRGPFPPQQFYENRVVTSKLLTGNFLRSDLISESHPGIFWKSVVDLSQTTARIILIWRDVERKYRKSAGVFVILKTFKYLTEISDSLTQN